MFACPRTGVQANRKEKAMSSHNCPIEFRLESTNERLQPWKWAVYRTSDGDQLAYSENYTSRAGAVNSVNAVRAGRATYEVFSTKTTNGEVWWYFRIKSTNGEILARSSYKYRSRDRAQAAANLIRSNAAEAPFYDYSKAA
jgi:uncharacterized protein YegP (UPF0339 family)